MLVVRGAILAEWSNSGVGSGLLWKIEIGEKNDIREGSLRGEERPLEEAIRGVTEKGACWFH